MATSLGPITAPKHDQIIEAIAQEMSVPVERVREVYECDAAGAQRFAVEVLVSSLNRLRLLSTATAP